MTDQVHDSARWLAKRARAVGPSTITAISRLSQERGAINLGEGIPELPTPEEIKDAAVSAIQRDLNQYRYVQEVCDRVARNFQEATGVPTDGGSQVALCCGQTGAFACVALAVFEQGDEALVLDPAFETYPACIATAGGTPKFVALAPPHWLIDAEALEAAVGPRTKAIVVNSPNNPTGRVLAREDLAAIARLCVKHDLLAITDEVYEHIVFDGRQHASLAALPGMRERTVVTSSLSKTYSVTGWRIGWAIAPPAICAAVANLQVKLTDSPPAPFQEAATVALGRPPEYYSLLKQEYVRRRDFTCAMLQELGLLVHARPQGGMFVFAEIPQSWGVDDVEFVKEVIETAGVAFVPGRIFFHDHGEQPPGRAGAKAQLHGDGARMPTNHGEGQVAGKGPTVADGGAGGGPGAGGSSALREAAELSGGTHGSKTGPMDGARAPSEFGSEVPAEGEGRRAEIGVHERYVRVAFCKSMATLEAAAAALKQCRLGGGGHEQRL